MSWAGLLLCSLRTLISKKNNSDNFNRIAIVQMGHLGDIIITLPLVRAFKNKFPKAEITLIVGSWGEDVVKAFAPDAKIMICDTPKFNRNLTRKKIYRPSLQEFDLFFHIRGDLNIVFEYFRHYRVAFKHALPLKNDLRWAPVYLLGIPFSKGNVSHQYERFRAVLAVDAIPFEERPIIEIKKEWEDSIKSILHEKGIESNELAVLHPGAPWKSRRWPIENFGLIASELIKKFKLNIVVIGSAEEHHLANYLKKRNIPAIDLTGTLDLSQLAALLKLCKIYIGNDSGPAHIASAVGAPVLTFYGPQEPKLFGTLSRQRIWLKENVFCSPCWQTSCIREKNCMSLISTDKAMEAICSLIFQSKKGSV